MVRNAGMIAPTWVSSFEIKNTNQRQIWIKEARRIATRYFGLILRQWQAEAIADVCMKRDVVVSAGTGMGKSIIFQCLPYMRRGGITLVISPLLSIIHDQVSWLQSIGISAVSLTAEDILAHPKLWREVQDGKHKLVYATPEALLSSESYFWTKILRNNQSKLVENLVAIAIDEAHVVWGYRQFRHEYANIGDLRVHLRSIPVLCLSATLTPNVLGYIHRVLLMASPSVIYRRPLGRSNVTLSVVPIIAQRRKSFALLDFLIDPAKSASFGIQKSFVFVDNVDEAHCIAAHLRGLRHPALRPRGREIIKVMSASLEPSTRGRNMDGLREGRQRIFVGTEVVAMGINFPDVDIIVQWGLVEHLTLASVWQRIGRAARNPLHKALAVIFAEELYIFHRENDTIGNENGYYYGWRQRAEESRRAEIQEFISRMYRSLDEQQVRCALDRIDPSLLFLLNTAGCRWRAGLASFGDPSWINGDSLLQLPQNALPSYCCDNCYFTRRNRESHEYSEEEYFVHRLDMRRTIPFTHTEEHSQNIYFAAFDKHLTTMNDKAVASDMDIPASVAALKKWRAQEYAHWVQPFYPSLPIVGFLSDQSINNIVSSISKIKSKADLAAVLLPKVSLENSILDPAVDSLLGVILLLQPAQTLTPAPRRRRYDFDHIPEDQLDVNIPTQADLLVAQHQITENDILIQSRALIKKSKTSHAKALKALAARELSSWNEKAQRLNLKARSEAYRGNDIFAVPPLPQRRGEAIISTSGHDRSLGTLTPKNATPPQKTTPTPKRPRAAHESTPTPKRPRAAHESAPTPKRPRAAQISTPTSSANVLPSTPRKEEFTAPVLQIPPATPDVRRGPARAKANIKFKTGE